MAVHSSWDGVDDDGPSHNANDSLEAIDCRTALCMAFANNSAVDTVRNSSWALDNRCSSLTCNRCVAYAVKVYTDTVTASSSE